MTPRLKILILILAILLAGVAAERVIFTDNDTIVAERSNSARAEPSTTKPLPAITALLPPITEFNEIWQRPLFTPTRKSTAIATTRINSIQSKASQNSQPPEFIIVGVAIRPDGGSVLIKKSRREIVRVLVGDEIDGWQVDKLDPKFVTISKNGENWQIPVGEQ